MDYYKYALARGGNEAVLLNKVGVTELAMRNVVLARPYFQRVVKLSKKNADAWNNLGAVEYLDGAWDRAISDYKKAAKLDRRKAVFHANLSTAYFERKDYSAAQREMGAAIALDPQIYERAGGEGGASVHVLSALDAAKFSFEMAKLYARNGLEEEMLRALAKASEAGMDVQSEMRNQPALAKYEMDPRVLALVHNAEMLRANRAETAVPPSTNGAAARAVPGK
jgi:tetratricopeptide (TPR) repeat protein